MTDKTLAGKIALVSAELSGWTADKRNKEQNYDYISADQVLTKAGSALSKQGVTVFPSAHDVQINIVERQGKTPRIDATVQFNMTVSDGDKEMTCAWVGSGSDYATPDKAVYKAITSGHKYFLMKLLNIGIGNEDGEHEQHEPAKPEKREPAKPETINAEIVTNKAWDTWLALVNKAEKLNIAAEAKSRADFTTTSLREEYKELLNIVNNAEAQAKAGA